MKLRINQRKTGTIIRVANSPSFVYKKYRTNEFVKQSTQLEGTHRVRTYAALLLTPLPLTF